MIALPPSLGLNGSRFCDPYFSSNATLLEFDGSDGSKTITDETANFTWTPFGTVAEIDTAQFLFGGSSLKLGGAGNYLRAPYSALIDPGAGDFTAEAWVYLNSLPVGGAGLVVGTYTVGSVDGVTPPGAGNAGWGLFVGPTGYVSAGYGVPATGDFVSWGISTDSSLLIGTGEWHFLTVSVKDGDSSLFVDGQNVSARSNVGDATAAKDYAYIGAYNRQTNPYDFAIDGWIDSLRVTQGVGRRCLDFPPPAHPFPGAC